MGLVERVSGELELRRRPQNLSLDEYASWFSFGGNNYPLLQTTYGQLDQERVAHTASFAARMHGPVFALVYTRIQVLSQIRFQWTRMQGARPGDLFGSPELRPLERPWPGGTTPDLLGRVEWDVSTAGNAYARRKGLGMFRLRPEWVTIVLGSSEDAATPSLAADTTVAGYFWNPPGGTPRLFTPQQVAHIAPIPDPDAHFLGQSWIGAVMREVQADQAAVEHKWRFFANSATPNLAIRFDPSVTFDQVKRFKELIEADHTGIANAFRTLYLGGGADPKTVGMSFKDMEYAVVQGRAESRLAAVAGVPPSWVGFSEGLQGSSLNAGNFTAARRRFSDATAAHWWSNVAASFEPLLSRPDPGASLWYDARIPFMRADSVELAGIQEKEAATIVALVKDGFTPDSAVAAVTNNDWGLLKHTGLTSVQLQPPVDGQQPQQAGFDPAALPANGNGNGARR